MLLDAADRLALRELRRELAVLTDGAPALGRVLPQLTELLRAEKAGAYGVEEWNGAFRPVSVHTVGDVAPTHTEALTEVLGASRRGGGRRFAWFDPDRPEPWQRNRVLTFDDLKARDPARPPPRPMATSLRTLGLIPTEQFRALVCDGPSLLSLVAVYRPGGWQLRERTLFQRIVPDLRRRLTLERTLGTTSILRAALDVALGEIAAPAYLVDRRGQIVACNAAAHGALDSDYQELRRALREAARAPTKSTRFRLTQVHAPGFQIHWLAVTSKHDAVPTLVASAAARWSLTRRQTTVLSWLAEGATNARIAAELDLSERTVEHHVEAIMLRAQCHSRAMLAAQVLGARGA